ncbi:hypothetical protein H0H92_004714 [Tricholoma furcatifolium]|nr:hypothetical protein H0H92_004714 [Tricholoma furcatifolium]
MSASSNWLALQKTLTKKSHSNAERSHKRRKLDHPPSSSSLPGPSKISEAPQSIPKTQTAHADDIKNGESLSTLRSMIFGDSELTEEQKLPGKYLALDCEMVGVGIDGAESSLARVSLVNFHGAVQLDEFVKQRERVVDYRTQYSGIRASDMIKAKPFEDIQKKVAALLKDCVLVGHAVHNDLKVLLLSHPRPMTRDTQYYAGKHKVAKSKYVALRNLVKQELGVTIQGGEHSSVTDARATMAVYRIHRKQWEQGSKPLVPSKKRKHADKDDEDQADDDGETKATLPGGGRKGVSSGLSTIVHYRTGPTSNGKTKWWKEVLNSKG